PCIFTPRSPLWREKQWLIVTATLCTALILLWWIPARQLGTYWTQSWIVWNTSSFTWPDYHEVLSIFRDLPWFLWPTWPLALVAIWQWRGWLSAPHIRIPLMFALWPLVT